MVVLGTNGFTETIQLDLGGHPFSSLQSKDTESPFALMHIVCIHRVLCLGPAYS